MNRGVAGEISRARCGQYARSCSAHGAGDVGLDLEGMLCLIRKGAAPWLWLLMCYQGNDARVQQLQQQLQEAQRLLTDADARAADCASDARGLKEANDHLTDKLRDEAADRRRADADKLKLAEVVRSLMITNEQLMTRDSRSVPAIRVYVSDSNCTQIISIASVTKSLFVR